MKFPSKWLDNDAKNTIGMVFTHQAFGDLVVLYPTTLEVPAYVMALTDTDNENTKEGQIRRVALQDAVFTRYIRPSDGFVAKLFRFPPSGAPILKSAQERLKDGDEVAQRINPTQWANGKVLRFVECPNASKIVVLTTYRASGGQGEFCHFHFCFHLVSDVEEAKVKAISQKPKVGATYKWGERIGVVVAIDDTFFKVQEIEPFGQIWQFRR